MDRQRGRDDDRPRSVQRGGLLRGLLRLMAGVGSDWQPDAARDEYATARGDESAQLAFPRLTERALKRLNNPLELARCDLLHELPHTLAFAREKGGDTVRQPTSLEQARMLRNIIVAAMEQLKPIGADGDSAAPAALHYQILKREYAMGMSAKQVMVRLSLPESSFHRYRRAAVAALGHELEEHEDSLRRRNACR